MKTEYKKVSDLLALNDKEVLQEFEMVELKGGKIAVGLMDNNGCNTRLCGADCPIYVDSPKKCATPPPDLNSIYVCK